MGHSSIIRSFLPEGQNKPRPRPKPSAGARSRPALRAVSSSSCIIRLWSHCTIMQVFAHTFKWVYRRVHAYMARRRFNIATLPTILAQFAPHLSQPLTTSPHISNPSQPLPTSPNFPSLSQPLHTFTNPPSLLPPLPTSPNLAPPFSTPPNLS